MFAGIKIVDFVVDCKQQQLLRDDQHHYRDHLLRYSEISEKRFSIITYHEINNLHLVGFVREKIDAFLPDY